jgi:hypothetical protein
MIAQVNGSAGEPVRIKGYAYDFGHRVSAVQFSLNGGRSWTTYETPGTNDYQNLTWTFDYVPPLPGEYELLVRSVNDRDQASPECASVHLTIA